MLWASSAQAQDAKQAIDGAAAAITQASGPPTILGLNLFEVLLLGAPPALYLTFSVYRSQVNSQAKVRASALSIMSECDMPETCIEGRPAAQPGIAD